MSYHNQLSMDTKPIAGLIHTIEAYAVWIIHANDREECIARPYWRDEAVEVADRAKAQHPTARALVLTPYGKQTYEA